MGRPRVTESDLAALSQRGRAAQESGASFESALESAHEFMRLNELALINKLPVPTVAVKGNPQFRRLVEKQGYDYFGTFGPAAGVLHGRAIAMEAKRTSQKMNALPIRRESGGIKPHQLYALDRASRFGAVAVVVWRNVDRRLLLPPRGVRNATIAYDRGVRSIPVEDFIEYPLTNDIGENWIHPIIQLWEKNDDQVRCE